MLKKYCDICERKIEKGLYNILNTSVKINKELIINLTNPNHTMGYFPDKNALCAQCFLEKFIETYKDQLNLEKKDIPGKFPIDWKAGNPTDTPKEKRNEPNSKS